MFLDPPPLLPDDPVPPADDHPFEFRPVFYRRDGSPIATQPEDAYLAEVAELTRSAHGRRVTRTSLYDRGTPITVSTVFLGYAARAGHPPLLWETDVFTPGGPDYRRHYASERAAAFGHALIVTAIRVGRADARTAHRARRAQPTAGPWRAGYRRRRR